MAVQIQISFSDALSAKVNDATLDTPWGGTTAGWKAWVKELTKQAITNTRLRKAQADADAALETTRSQILGEDTELGV